MNQLPLGITHSSNVSAGRDGGSRDWGHLPAVAVQRLGRHCCPASKAKLRVVCRTWHDALATQFTEVFLGPGSPWPSTEQHMHQSGTAAVAGYDTVMGSFPAAHSLCVTASSSRDYPATYTQDLAQLLCSMPGLMHLSLQELHELEDFDNLDPSSLWDALDAAAAAPGGLVSRLVGLSVSDCFWNTQELFGVLKQLTCLTNLRLSNNPLETACEVGIIASLTQLKVLELGLIFDGSSQHHDMPRALEEISNLTRLQELSIPMWRRSLGGRAHPLAPSLAVVLSKLTGLTSLAVDGKFGHLTVVSCLTNLRRLASAAPLSTEGWKAISQLPQLTLLTSLTPPAEPLRLNPTRPHGGLDLGMLATKGCLQGLDVAVMQPEHLATLGQFTALQNLNLRCAETFQQPQQQAQLLTALSCLPGTLTSLTLGPLLPLTAKLLTTVAKSCPLLQSLSARFSHVRGFGSQGFEGMERRGSLPVAAVAAAAESGEVSPVGSLEDNHDFMQMNLGTLDGVGSREDLTNATAAAIATISSSSSVSSALRRLGGLTSLELVLITEGDTDNDSNAYGTSGGGVSSRPTSSAGIAATAAAAATAAHADLAVDAAGVAVGQSVVCLALEDLPRNLKRLVLTGPWQLGFRYSGSRRVSTAATQQQQQQKLPCAVCGRIKTVPAAAEAGDNPVLSLCHCMNALGFSTGFQADLDPQAAAGSTSPSKQGRPTLGHKRPGSYPPNVPAAAATAGIEGYAAAAAAAEGAAVVGPPAESADVFVLEGSAVLEKRSRSYGMPSPAAAAAMNTRQQQQQLPVLSQLCLFQCHIPYTALVQLVSSAGLGLQKLQLLQVHTNPLPHQSASPAAAPLLSPRSAAAAAAARTARLSSGGSSSSSSCAFQDPTELTTEQLLQLPVVWSHLEEWHLHPHHLWGLIGVGRFSSSSSSGLVSQQQQGGSQPQALQHLSQLLNLRHMYVVNRPLSFTAEHTLVRDYRYGETITSVPLHDSSAVELLLQQLQEGLQQMPALRQLLLYMGNLTKQQPDAPDNCEDLWLSWGERLLESMPACKVKVYSPIFVVHRTQSWTAGGTGVEVVYDRVHNSPAMEGGPQGQWKPQA